MTRNAAFATCGLALALIVLSTGRLTADDRVADEFYGSGVHQYFAGNFGQAASDLSAAIAGGTKDPRAYYFRALVEMRLGRQASAEADLRRAAVLEGADVDQFYAVGKSLERVQGRERMTIERHRALARAEAYQRRHERDALRYEQRRSAESQVLRSSGTTRVAEPAAAPVPAVPAASEVTDDDPFAEEGEKKPAAKKPPADEEPAAEEMPAEEMPADDEVPADEKPADGDAKDSAPKTDDDNPFGDDPSEAK